MSEAELALLARVAVGFALGFVVGFERELRGSPAGDRTFALVVSGSAAITAVAAHSSPQAIAGVVTGVGFIGGAVVLHREGGAVISGVTTAATIFASAGIGLVVGFGHLILGVITAALVLVVLELQHIPGLRRLDASNFERRFQRDRSHGAPTRPPAAPEAVAPPAAPEAVAPPADPPEAVAPPAVALPSDLSDLSDPADPADPADTSDPGSGEQHGGQAVE